jgi:hypothetical protein
MKKEGWYAISAIAILLISYIVYDSNRKSSVDILLDEASSILREFK